MFHVGFPLVAVVVGVNRVVGVTGVVGGGWNIDVDGFVELAGGGGGVLSSSC